MPTMTFSQLKVSAVLAACALALAGCGGGQDDQPDAADPSPTVEPLPSTTVKVPEKENVTPPGTQLAFGATATVTHEVKNHGTVLGLTVESAAKGSLKDFTGFDLDDPYKKRGSYYYVRVTVKNAGKGKLGGIPVPLWGISGDNTLLQPVQFKSAFKKCPTEPLPESFRPGDAFRTCLVFLSPDHGALAGVSYRPYADYVPIEWHGKVTPLPSQKPGKTRTSQGKG